MHGQRTSVWTRRLTVVAAIAAIAGSIVEYWPQESVVPWRSFPDALAEAQQKGRPVFLDLYATWCGPCKEMDRVTFTNDTVQALLAERFIPARLDIDTPLFSDSLKKSWNIKGVPTSMIVSSTGGVLRRRVGFQSAQQMIGWLSDSTLTATSTWDAFPDARVRSQRTKKPMLIVIVTSAERVEDLDAFVADSTIRRFVSTNFEPVLLVQEGPSALWIDTVRAATPVSFVSPFGGLLIAMTADGRDLGQLPLSSIDLGDAQMIRQTLERYIKNR